MAYTNIQFINALRETASTTFKERVPSATKGNIQDIIETITSYPTIKNEFVDVLTNQVAKTIFLNKLYNNPLKFFKKGSLPFGKTIESVFVDLVQAKSFTENFGDSQVSSLISNEKVNNVKVEYYTENFRHKYKISISDQQLKGAFRDVNGLSTLTQKLLVSPLNSAEFDEYLIMKQLLNHVDLAEVKINAYATLPTDLERAKTLTMAIKTMINKFRFMSPNFNKQGVKTFTLPNELIVLVTPETKALIDVELLSSAFNLEKTEIESRLVMIDTFTKQVEGTDGTITYSDDVDTLAIVCDENLIQFYDTENTTENFRNADTLSTNMFYHRWGIASVCGFVNGVKFKK